MPYRSAGAIALVAAPIAAAAATIILMVTTGPVPQVFIWGGLITVISLIPTAVPARHKPTSIWICAAAVFVALALAILSIGAYFLPAFLALVIAGFAYRPSPD